MSRLPEVIQVGPYRYRVVLDRAAIDALSRTAPFPYAGHSDHHAQVITLDPELGPDAAAETLLHECLHAIFGQVPTVAIDQEAEERLVYALAYSVLDLLRRNPELVAFLLKEVPRG